MTSAPKLRLGMAGAGAIAQTYALALKQSLSTELVGVADVRQSAAVALAAGGACPGFTDYRALLDEAGCQAVVICTPPNTHPEIAAWFLERGVHVLCEKPLALDVDAAREMLAAADRSDALLTMASKFRYVDDVVRAKALVESGVIGEVVLFENAFTSRVDMSRRWNSDPEISGGGVLIDNGTHSVDIMRYFLGPLAEIQVIEGKRIQDIPVEDTVRVFVRSVSGVMGNIDLSWSVNKELPNYISIYGSEGTIHVGWKEARFRRSSDAEWTIYGRGYDKVQAFGSQLDNFAAAVAGHEPLRITLEDALASVEVIETAYDAMWRTSWVPVEQSLSQAAVTYRYAK